jgi:hypothetical protein
VKHVGSPLADSQGFDATTGAIWFGFTSGALPRLAWLLAVIDLGVNR